MIPKLIHKISIGIFLLPALFFLAPSDASAEMKVISRFGGTKTEPRVAHIDGTICYTFDKGGYIRAWDMSDPKDFKLISQYDQRSDYQWNAKSDLIKFQDYHSNDGGISQGYNMAIGTFSKKKLAFILTGHQGVQVVDVTNPNSMYLMGGRPEYGQAIEGSVGMCESIKIKGLYIFKNLWGGFAAMKYAPLASLDKDGGPFELIVKIDFFGTEDAMDLAKGLDVSQDGHYLYVARGSRMDIYNITEIKNPKMIYSYRRTSYPYTTERNNGVCVKAYKNMLFYGTAKDLRVFDISDPESPKPFNDKTGKEVIYPLSASVVDIKAYKNYVFLYYGPLEKVSENAKETGLEVVDVSNPREPKFVDSLIIGGVQRNDYYRRIALISKKGIIILSADTYYVLDVSAYTQ